MRKLYILLLLAILCGSNINCSPSGSDSRFENETFDSRNDSVRSIEPISQAEEIALTTDKEDSMSAPNSISMDEPPVKMTWDIRYSSDYEATFHYTIFNNSHEAIIAYEFGHILNADEISAWKLMNEHSFTGRPKPEAEIYTIKRLKNRIAANDTLSGTIALSKKDTEHRIRLVSYISESGRKVKPENTGFILDYYRNR